MPKQAEASKTPSSWFSRISVKAKGATGIFSLLLSVVMTIGWHIVLCDGSPNAGTVEQCYISPFTWLDALTVIVVSLALWVVLLGIFSLMTKQTQCGACAPGCSAGKSARQTFIQPYAHNRVSVKWLLICSAVLFAAWLPYLLTYWPGLIFGDSTWSISQAQGSSTLSNHYPYFFTLLVKISLWLGVKIGVGATGGCAIFSLGQMIAMAFIFSYQACWLQARFCVHKAFCVAVVVVFAFSPYVATYSIAMWKDPLFCAALVVLTLMILDAVFSRFDAQVVTARFAFIFGIVTLLMCLLRNNGIYVAAVLLVIFGIMWFIAQRKKKAISNGTAAAFLKNASFECSENTSIIAARPLARITASLLMSVVIAWVISGPLYTSIGIEPSEAEESLGVPLAQMAAVVAKDGNMSESDREYMGSILPLDQYKSAYHPTLIDYFKWDANFNSEPLQHDFWSHWASMLARNPEIYAEAWVMQTFGYWTVNVPQSYTYSSNIIAGGIRTDDLERFDIYTQNLLGTEDVKNVLVLQSPFVPIGIIFWALLYLGICMVLLGRTKWLLALVPSLALVGTLIIASPIWYWPRYAAVLQFLIPLWIVLFAACMKPINNSTALDD